MAQTYRSHSESEREVLRKAGLSKASELREGEKLRLREMADDLDAGKLGDVSGPALRYYIMPSQRPDGIQNTNTEGESIMAKNSKPAGRPKAKPPTKSEVAKLAKLRREGATWGDLDDVAGKHRSSTAYRELFEEYGFDKFGRSNPSQTTKAKAWGSAKVNGSKPKAKAKGGKKRVVNKTKATAKK